MLDALMASQKFMVGVWVNDTVIRNEPASLGEGLRELYRISATDVVQQDVFRASKEAQIYSRAPLELKISGARYPKISAPLLSNVARVCPSSLGPSSGCF